METLGQADIEQSRENNLESTIDKMDQNKDGRILYREFKSHMLEILKKRTSRDFISKR